jgi:hypothetical protein
VNNQLSKEEMWVNSPLGRRLPDSAGARVGMARLDPEKSYAGVGELLRQVINDSRHETWDKIKGI